MEGVARLPPTAIGPAPSAPTFDEQAFQQWYATQSKALGLAPNPDDPLHFYDWRGAYSSGAKPDATGHWPSEFKQEGHPNLYMQTPGGMMDTRTGIIKQPKPEITEEDLFPGATTARTKTKK